jgi:hypothetical protein
MQLKVILFPHLSFHISISSTLISSDEAFKLLTDKTFILKLSLFDFSLLCVVAEALGYHAGIKETVDLSA